MRRAAAAALLCLPQARAYVVCLPYVSCFEVQHQTLKLQLEAYWCPPGGSDDEFDWHGEDAQLRMGCVFRGLELVARIGAFGGDVRRAVEAGVLALNLPERETVEATIVQARNATCQAILSLTLAARKSLGAPFARGCDGETISIMAERDVLDGKARLFTMPFSATLTMWQLSFGMGAIDLAGDLLNECERYVATWKDIGGVAASLIRETKDVWSAPFRDRDQMAVASVSKSRVTVLGDACHPMTCFKGQGAKQALADAVLLARRVAEANDVPKALRRFEREMVQRAGPRAAASRCAARLLHSPSALTAELPSFARVDDSSLLCERLREANDQCRGKA